MAGVSLWLSVALTIGHCNTWLKLKMKMVVGPVENLESDTFEVERCNWIAFEELNQSIEVTTRIRYNHSGTMATVEPGENGRATVHLHEPQRAIAPGQACVFYQDDLVVGGGWITK